MGQAWTFSFGHSTPVGCGLTASIMALIFYTEYKWIMWCLCPAEALRCSLSTFMDGQAQNVKCVVCQPAHFSCSDMNEQFHISSPLSCCLVVGAQSTQFVEDPFYLNHNP